MITVLTCLKGNMGLMVISMRDGAARDRGQVAAHGRHGALRPHDGAKGAAHREPELLDRARRRPQVVRVDGVSIYLISTASGAFRQNPN